MRISQFLSYAVDRCGLSKPESNGESGQPGALRLPETGEKVVVFMRHWDEREGAEREYCDLKCGREALCHGHPAYLTEPFLMKGPSWIGVRLNECSQPEVIRMLLDDALSLAGRKGSVAKVFKDTPIRPSHESAEWSAFSRIPERISAMLEIYPRRAISFEEKCMVFRKQAEFMEDYEDDVPWNGRFDHFFPTYHDMNLKQLRGYFTWRKHVRKGDPRPAPYSFACVHAYEIIHGVGVSSVQDGFDKLMALDQAYPYPDGGLSIFGAGLKRWICDYAIVNGVGLERVREMVDKARLSEYDKIASALCDPDAKADEEVVGALARFCGSGFLASPIMERDRAKGMRLFANAWRSAVKKVSIGGKDFLSAYLGDRVITRWQPFANAVYCPSGPVGDVERKLGDSHVFRCRSGVWSEMRYEECRADRARIRDFVHEVDGALRKRLGTGRQFRIFSDDAAVSAFAKEYAETVGREMERERIASISIASPNLERIRDESDAVQDSIMTDFEREMADVPEEVDSIAAFAVSDARECPETDGAPRSDHDADSSLLDGALEEALMAALQGADVAKLLKERHLMPSVVASSINEALYDAIGDNCLECDGERLVVIEEYRQDILRVLGKG